MKPYPFQAEMLNEFDRFHGRVLCATDMGLGKTPMSLWHADRHNAWPLVVVCPASLKWQWQAEVMKVLNVRASVCEGQRPGVSLAGDRIVIVNYDILQRWLPKLKSLKPRMVVIDECHYVQNNQTKRTKAVRELCRGVRRLLMLSGTPLVNRPIELFPALQMLRPSVFSSRFSYGLEYCGGRRGRWGWEFKGATRTGQLHRLLLSTCMVRKRKSEVLKELPAKVRQVVPVDLSDVAEYRRAEGDFIAWLRQQDPNAAIRAKRAEAVVKVGYLLRLAARLKCRAVIEWVNNWLDEADGKLVLFAVHRKMVEALHRRVNCKSVTIDGSVAGRDRKLAVEQFQADRRTRVLIGNVQAAGVGLNLTAAASVAFSELPWQPGAVTQAEDRCHRIGQDESVNIYYLVAHGTAEEKRATIIREKQRVLSAVLDGGRVDGNLDVFDEFLSQL